MTILKMTGAAVVSVSNLQGRFTFQAEMNIYMSFEVANVLAVSILHQLL